jgi:hypothetical protein
MKFDNKIVAILREDLMMWQKLNITAFIMTGIGGLQDILGEPYVDGAGNTYLPMSKQPIMIYAATGEQLKELLLKALNKEINMAIYTEELFNTYNDADNRAKVAESDTNNLNLVGIGMVGKKNHVDRLTKGLSLYE